MFHTKFGPGAVIAVDGAKLTVDFDKAGRKLVMDSFVTAEMLAKIREAAWRERARRACTLSRRGSGPRRLVDATWPAKSRLSPRGLAVARRPPFPGEARDTPERRAEGLASLLRRPWFWD